MKKIIILYSCLCLLFSTCTKDVGNNDNNNSSNIIPILQMEDSVIVSVPYLWKTSLHGNQPTGNSIIRAHLIYNDNPIIATTGDGKRWLSMLDIGTGEELWKWNDIYEAPTEKLSIIEAYINNDLMTYQVGTRSYCINLDNGTTHWKLREQNSLHSRISGFGNTYFLLGQPTDTLQAYRTFAGYRCNLESGEKESYLLTDIRFDTGGEVNRVSTIERIKPFQTSDGKNYLVVASVDPNPNWFSTIFIGLYDYDNEQWIYNRKIVNESSNVNDISNIEIINNKVYLSAGRSMNCHDLWTGERIWKSPSSSVFWFSNFVVEQGKVVGLDEDEIVYCWDAETGAELWRAPGAGTSSELRYLNGIVYFSGGSTGRIHGIDIETGKTVWLLKPELMDGTDDFKPDIYAIEGKNGEKGKLVICTHTNAFCVEAYQ